MKKPNLNKFFKDVRTGISKNSPTILTAVGICGMVSATVLAVKATPKALKKIEIAEEEKGEELTPIEKVTVAWKPYAPAVATSVFSIACLISSNSVHARRNAALATCYKISETALAEYREKVVEAVGEKKERTIRDAVAKDKIEKNPSKDSSIIVTGNGDSLMYDPLSGRYFMSSIDKVKRAELELNSRMVNGSEMYMSLNEFYDEIGLHRIDIGENMGWTASERLDISFSSQISDEGKPCIVIDHLQPPVYEYRDMY